MTYFVRVLNLFMRLLSTVTLTSLLAACSVGEEPSTTKESKKLEQAERPDPYSESSSRHGEVVLHAGFSPDPTTVTGTTVGEMPAKRIHSRCSGWVGREPDYLLRARTAFFKLHVMARSRDDVALVVRKPDGRVLCNDNRYGKRDPMVHSSIPIGTSQVFIATRKQNQETTYRLGFSELKWKPSELSLP